MPSPVAAPTKALYLALDACDATTMRAMAAAGRCPNLARLLTEAAVVETVAPYGTFVGSVWKTLSTGLDVGHHKYFNWLQLAEGSYEFRHTSPTEALGTPFWETLSDRGRRLAVFDVPHAQVPASFNGALLKEWGCHDRHHGTGSWPPALARELEAAVGPHPYGSMPPPRGDDQFAPCDYVVRAGAHRTIDEQREIHGLIAAGVEAKRRASLHLLERGGWDLFMTVVGESHCVGHQLWHVHDPTHPQHHPALRHLLGDPVVDVYSRLDALVGDHLAAAGPEATCYVHLSHGMRAHYDGDHVLDEVLHRIEVAHDGSVPTGWRTAAARRLLERLPAGVRARVQPLAGAALRRRIAGAPPSITHGPGPQAGRRWYQVPNNTVVGAVRFNLVGREPAGWVRPEEVSALTEVITAGLGEVINVDTGRPAVRRVVRSDDVLERSEGDTFPDLFVEWDRDAPIERVWSPMIGTVHAPYDHWRTGDHDDRGLLLVTGPGIAPGTRAQPMAIAEMAATLSAAIGEELPDADGAPRRDLVSPPMGTGRGALAPSAPVAPRPRHPAPSSSDDTTRLAEGALDLARSAAERAQRALHVVEQQASGWQAALADLERANLVWTTMRWLDAITVEEDRLVTVITPTHKRPEALAAAIASVQAQTYERWEMVIVDDGGDTAKHVVAAVGDERVRALRIDHSGPAAARNAALAAATGVVITYLDDDNTLDPGWLKAVVWAFQNRPDAEVLYGARMIDDKQRVHEQPEGGWPWLQHNAFDWDRLRRGNLADMGVIAHLAGLPEAHFDERLWEYADWDILLALTEHRTPVELPAIAVYYRTQQSERLSGAHRNDEALVLEKWADRTGTHPPSTG